MRSHSRNRASGALECPGAARQATKADENSLAPTRSQRRAQALEFLSKHSLAQQETSAAAIEATAASVFHTQRAAAIAGAPTSVQAVTRSQQLIL